MASFAVSFLTTFLCDFFLLPICFFRNNRGDTNSGIPKGKQAFSAKSLKSHSASREGMKRGNNDSSSQKRTNAQGKDQAEDQENFLYEDPYVDTYEEEDIVDPKEEEELEKRELEGIDEERELHGVSRFLAGSHL